MREQELIRGEDAIRQVIHEWRQHLITNWRDEPLRLTTAIPESSFRFLAGASQRHLCRLRLTTAIPESSFPGHQVELSGHTGRLYYAGFDARYPLYWGCNLVGFEDGYKPPGKLAIGLSDAYPNAHELPAIGCFQAMLPAIYDPILLLFYHLAGSSLYGLVKGEPITAHEIVERSEQAFNKREQDDYGNNWIRVSGYWYPAELLTIARERL